MQEVENYRKLKAVIRNQDKTKVNEITKEQREDTLEQARKEGKEDFLQKIRNSSGIRNPGHHILALFNNLADVQIPTSKTILDI